MEPMAQAQSPLVNKLLGENAALLSECRRQREQIAKLRAALEAIAGGRTGLLIGAPDPMTAASSQSFQSAMWISSQATARAALAETEGE